MVSVHRAGDAGVRPLTRRKAKPARRPSAVLFVGDLHVGSRQALCPPALVRGHLQAHLSAAWADLLKRAAVLGRETRLTVALGGDLVEGFHHGNTDDWAGDEDEQAQAALELLTPLAARAHHLMAVTGTEAHAGRLGAQDRYISRELGAKLIAPGQDVEIAGRWLDWQHHGASVGRLPWTTEQPIYNQARAAWHAALVEGRPAPALIMRHHVHQMPGAVVYRGTWAAVCGCWQGVTAFGARMGYKASGIGCWVWYPQDGRLIDWRWPYREKAYKHGTD